MSESIRRLKLTRTAIAVGGALFVGCASPPPERPRPADAVRGIEFALSRGDTEAAERFASRGRVLHPNDGLVQWWCARVATALWQDELATRSLRALARSQDRARLTSNEIDGLLGEQLFLVGKFGESLPLLDAHVRKSEEFLRRQRLADPDASPDPERLVDLARRQAMARVALYLPFQRSAAGAFATELPLQAGELPELSCLIGRRERPFVLDTGSSLTAMSAALADELGVLEIVSMGTLEDGLGQPMAASLGVVGSFALGNVRLGTLPVLIVGDAQLAMRDAFGGPDRPPVGVIGLDVLTAFRVTLDPERRSVLLARPRGLAALESVQTVRVDGRCLAPVQIEGRDFWFVLDTGASHSSFTPSGLDRLPDGASRAVPAFRRVRGAGGSSMSVRGVRDLVLTLDDVRFRGVALPVVPRDSADWFPVHGVLGADLLLQVRITLDQGRLQAAPQGGG